MAKIQKQIPKAASKKARGDVWHTGITHGNIKHRHTASTQQTDKDRGEHTDLNTQDTDETHKGNPKEGEEQRQEV